MSASDTSAPARPLPPARVRTRIRPVVTDREPKYSEAEAVSATPSVHLADGPEATTDEYKVGYKHPPKHTQFKKGQVGNPKGRPKGAKSLETLVDEGLSAEVTITKRGRPVKMTKREVMVLQQIEKAMRGDLKTFATLVKLDPRARREAEERDQAPPELSADEMALLLSYVRALEGEEGER